MLKVEREVLEGTEKLIIKSVKNIDEQRDSYEDYIFANDFELKIDFGKEKTNNWYYNELISSVNCITGRNGTGKSTLLNAIEKFYIKNHEQIIYYSQNAMRVNGKEISKDVTIFELYEYISMSMDKTLSEKLSENIRIFNKEEDAKVQLIWNNAFSKYDSNISELFNYKPSGSKTKDILDKLMSQKEPKTNEELIVRANDRIKYKWDLLSKYFDEAKVDIGVSLGELARIRLFTSIEKTIEDLSPIVTSNEIICILLDEPDTNFHPEWSRTFLYDLINYLSAINTGYKFRLIITSHSPLVIADVPTNQVNFLDFSNNKIINDDKRGKTMGLELNSLFKNLFYLDDERGKLFTTRFMELIDTCINTNCTFEEEEEIDLKTKITFLNDNISDPVLKNTLQGITLLSNNRFENQNTRGVNNE
ncbi:AAA family ATPase [Mollicutes bacterium LVI A0078]|nr:AAA family ATPase [Mollicutes bacterium LVI A0075]WOO90180.1 AAA family ATPase [Mollicutes bacterium LVI A0078]